MPSGANANQRWPVEVVPVIDLADGLVVRAAGGKRAAYRPLTNSLICDNALPYDVARAFARRNFSASYVADLDAIGGAPFAWHAYASIASSGLAMWIDAGLVHREHVEQLGRVLSEQAGARVILSSESLADLETLRWAMTCDYLGPERMTFSLDLRGGRVLKSAALDLSDDPLAAASALAACGLRRLIVLELDAVGSLAGAANLQILNAMHRQAPLLELYAGGGVRNTNDLAALRAAGCRGALVASALHDGSLPDDSLPGTAFPGTAFPGSWPPVGA